MVMPRRIIRMNNNVWVGKCVSLAKALGKPIPDFIKNKNMEG